MNAAHFRQPLQPDWRWHAVNVAFNEHRDLPLELHTDIWCRKLLAYRQRSAVAASATYPDISSAFQLWAQDEFRRAVLESLLLAEASNDDILMDMHLDPSVIEAYVACFFDIRGRKRADVVAMVFRGPPHKNYHGGDMIGTMHRIAWFGGIEAVRAVLACGALSEQARECQERLFADIIARQLPEVALSLPYRPEYVIEMWKAMQESRLNRQKEREFKGKSDSVVEQVEAALRTVQLKLADHAQQNNLSKVDYVSSSQRLLEHGEAAYEQK